MEVAKTFGPCRICGEPTRHIGDDRRGYVHMLCIAEERDRKRREWDAKSLGQDTRFYKQRRWRPPAASMPDNVSHTPAPVYSTLVDALRSYGDIDRPSLMSDILGRVRR